MVCPKRLNNENGATSVLVILMMIVLVSLGYFAIASANSNIKLSNNAIDWNKRYYELDAFGEAFVYALDKRLINAQTLTNEYMANEEYLNITHGVLPMELHSSFYDGYLAAADKAAFLEAVMDKVYLFYADKELESFNGEYPNATVSVIKDGNEVISIVCDLTLTSEEAPDYHLDISANVNSLSSLAGFVAENNSGVPAYAGRYRVSKWIQWQNAPNQSEGIKVWDGIIKTP